MLDIGYYTSEALTLLQALIGIPSISREEEAAADFLQNYIEETGIMTGRSGNNIWCISPMFNTQRPTILLNSHIDTVKPVNGWRKQPFTPKMETVSSTVWEATMQVPVWYLYFKHTGTCVRLSKITTSSSLLHAKKRFPAKTE